MIQCCSLPTVTTTLLSGRQIDRTDRRTDNPTLTADREMEQTDSQTVQQTVYVGIHE